MRTVLAVLSGLFLSVNLQAQDSINWGDALTVAPSEYGYTNLRMVLDTEGNPVILHGKSGSSGGLYCTRWTGTGFGTPVAVTNETGLFINDAEGPRMAVSANRIAVSYQLSGQWDDGGRVVISEDGGATWTSVGLNDRNFDLMAVKFLSNKVAFAVGTNDDPFDKEPRTVMSVDSGKTWTVVNNSAQANLNDVFFPNTAIGFTGGAEGEFMKLIPITVGEAEIKLGDFKVFPNPFSESIFLEFNSEDEKAASYQILDLSGRRVKSASAVALVEQIDLSDLESSTYILELEFKDKKEIRRLIKR